MSSAYIIAIIIVLLAALTCYALLAQSIEKKRQQKQRILSALKLRSKNFKHMLNGFPADFLTKDLQILVTRCLVDVCEQLAKIEPGNKAHLDELKLYSQQLEALKAKPKSAKRTSLKNPQQIKEVKHHLEELNNFINQMVKRNNFTPSQASAYQKQIQRLVMQITVDSYLTNARQSQQSGKTRLAIHYYTLALKLVTKEGGDQAFKAQIGKLREVIINLESQLAEEEPDYKDTARSAAAKNAASKEWDQLDDNEDLWKKKNLYD